MSTAEWHPSVPQTQRLSPSERIITPIAVSKPKDGQPVTPGQSLGGKISVDVCSEFTTYHAQVEYFKKSGKIKLLHTKAGEPLVFALTEASELCLLQHGVYDVQGWSSADLTPVDNIATTFDVLQMGNTLHLAVSCKPKDSKSPYHELYYARIEIEQSQLYSLYNGLGKDQKWTKVLDNTVEPVGNLIISSLLCNLSEPVGLLKARKFEIVVGSSTTEEGNGSDKFGTFYRVNPEADERTRWNVMSFPAAASTLLQSEPLVIGSISAPSEQGMVSVFKDFAQNAKARVVGHITDPTGGISRTFEFKTGRLGDTRSVFSHRNPWSRTDIFIASANGIGYYSCFAPLNQLDTLAAEPILPDVAFRQVFCSEAADPAAPKVQSKLALFAVSDDNSLYYIEGTRRFDGRLPTFVASGLPIRKGVTHMSTVYSAVHGTSELLYGVEEENALLYLRREPQGQFWLEDRVSRKAHKFVKYDAFVSSLALMDGGGQALGAGYPLHLTGEHVQVVVNGKSVGLSPSTPTCVYTDATGCIEVVQAAERRLGCPPIRVTLKPPPDSPSTDTFSFAIDPSSRVDRLMSGIKGADDLKTVLADDDGNAFTGTGLSEAGDLMSQFGDMKAVVKRVEKGEVPTPAPEPPSSGGVIDTVVSFLGECIEAVKTVVKAAVKVVIKVLGPVVRVIFTIYGRQFAFHIKAVYLFLNIFGEALEFAIGENRLSNFLKYLKVALDPKSIRSTQLFFRSWLTGIMDLVGRFLDVNKDSVSNLFDDGADWLREYVEDTRQPPEGTVSNTINTILNNPVVRLLMRINPLQWILEAISEEAPDFQIPPIGNIVEGVMSAMGDAVDKQVDIMNRQLETIITELERIFSNPLTVLESAKRYLQSMVWTLFDSIRNLIESLYDALTNLVKSLSPILDGVWKIPGLTELWEDLTGQEFTLLGVLTYLPAVVCNLACIYASGHLPFEGKPLSNFDDIEIKPLYKSKIEKEELVASTHARETAPTPFEKTSHTLVQTSIDIVGAATFSRISASENNIKSSALLYANNSEGDGKEKRSANLTFGRIIELIATIGRIFNAGTRAFQAHGEFKRRYRDEPLPRYGQGIELVGGHHALPNPGPGPNPRPRHDPRPGRVDALLRRFVEWLPNIGRFIGAAGNLAFAVWHLKTHESEDVAPDLVMATFAVFELAMMVAELRGCESQGLRLVGEFVGRGGAILQIALVREWEFGMRTVSLTASTICGVSAEALRLGSSASPMGAAGVFHAGDCAWGFVYLVSFGVEFLE
ncbi:hypothetical protein F4802DRAFT_337581 [Xylaria palmicola]|nr:hypothetical protein F4802DRAFT_337581 [Xylaria palmicola]